MEKFSIMQKLNLSILNDKIKSFRQTNECDPIIIVGSETSKALQSETPKALQYDQDFIWHHLLYCITNPDSKYEGCYEGCRVFIDPTMKYGDIEIR